MRAARRSFFDFNDIVKIKMAVRRSQKRTMPWESDSQFAVTLKEGENDMHQSEHDRSEQEAAYRRGFTHGLEEMARLVFQLLELGYATTEIKRLLAVYDDHFVAPWRASDLTNREAPPPFDIDQCKTILEGTSGYDWIV